MGLTTSDDLQKQLTVIFGYKGLHEIEVGEIRGIGKLSVHHTDYLISETLEFLNSYDMMLKDFAGCELYSIEFELNQFEKHSETKILPRSMLFIPGVFKNSHSLLLILAPQMSLLDNEVSKNSINHVNQLLYEIEDAINLKELKEEQREIILKNFANRFTLKLQGEVIETKWNRKLVGIKEERRELQYLTLNLENYRNWRNREITIKNPRFGYPRLKLSEEDKFEFSKYSINSSVAYIIGQKSFQLGSNLLKIANTGTTDDNQKQFLILFLNLFTEYAVNHSENLDFDRFNRLMGEYINLVKDWVNQFKDIYLRYINKVALKSLQDIEKDYNQRYDIHNQLSLQDKFLYYLGQITIRHMQNFRYSFHSYEKIRSGELKTPLLFILESVADVLHKISSLYQNYNQFFFLDEITGELMEILHANLKSIDNKAILILGEKYLVQFREYLSQQFELKSREINVRNQVHLLLEFKNYAKEMIEPFIQSVGIEIKDLIDYCLRKFANSPKHLQYLNKLATFPDEMEFIWGFIFRNSTLQRFLKDLSNTMEFSPQNFGEEFISFLKLKRIAGFNLNWREQIFKNIKDFIAKFEPLYQSDKGQGQNWSKNQVGSSFIEYINNRIKKETTLEGFIEPMKIYIDNIALSNIQNKDVVQIYESYIEALDILDQFPDYLRQVFFASIENLTQYDRSIKISELIGPIRTIDEMINYELQDLRESFETKKSLYSYIVGEEMKYFSSLLPIPKNLVLKSLEKPPNLESPLLHRIEFQNLRDKFVKMTFTTNYTGNTNPGEDK